MFPTEADVEKRLAELRRRREEIEAEIGDIERYLELGRRLAWLSAWSGEGAAAPRGPEAHGEGARPAARPIPEVASPSLAVLAPAPSGPAAPEPSAPDPVPPGPAACVPSDPPEPRPPRPGEDAEETPRQRPRGALPPPAAPPVGAPSPGGGRMEARRYGHQLMDAVADALREAGRPLHVSEVYAAVRARGFDLPGRSPVAALNTRLWKRARGGSGIVQDGEATYRLREGTRPEG